MGSGISIQVTGFVGSESQVKEVGEQRVTSFSQMRTQAVNSMPGVILRGRS